MGRIRFLSLFVALALVLTACGDDDDAATTDTTEAPADTGDDDATDDAGAEDEETDDGSDVDVSDLDLGECGFMAEFALSFDDVDEAAMFGGEGGDFGDFIGGTAEALRAVADEAPSEIEDAFRTMADTFGEAAEGLEGVTLDFSDPENVDPEAMQAFEEVGALFEDPDFTAASEDIDAWMEANCPDFAEELDLEGFGGGA